MNYYLDTGKNEPAYIQLYRHFVNDIISGGYSYGDKLPSKRTVAEEAGVSVITAEHALGLLCEEGYIESRQRSGYYVIYRNADFLGDGRKLLGLPEKHSRGLGKPARLDGGTEWPGDRLFVWADGNV